MESRLPNATTELLQLSGASASARVWLLSVAGPALETKGVLDNVIFPRPMKEVDSWLTAPIQLTSTSQARTKTAYSTQGQQLAASGSASGIASDGIVDPVAAGGASAGLGGATSGLVGIVDATTGLGGALPAISGDVILVNPDHDMKARGIMKKLMSPAVIQHVNGCKTAQDIWSLVEDWALQYELGPGKYETEAAWTGLSMGPHEGVYEYMHRARNIALAAVRAEVPLNFSEVEAVRRMIGGLIHFTDGRFRPTALESLKRPMTFQEAVASLRFDELLHQKSLLETHNTVALAASMAGAGGGAGGASGSGGHGKAGGAGGKKHCLHCNKSGHTQETCWQLHPQLKHLRQQNQRLQKKVTALTAQLSSHGI